MTITTAQIRGEQIRALLQAAPLTLAGTLALGLTARVILADPQLTGILNLFVAIMLVLFVVRLTVYLQWRRSNDPTAIKWGYLECVLGGLVALYWCWLSFQILPGGNPIAMANMAMLIVGMVAGAMITQGVFFPAFLCVVIPLVLPVSVLVVFLPGSFLHLAVFSFLYGLFSLWFAWQIRQIQRDSIASRLRNEQLVLDLQHEKAKVEAANVEKSNFFAAASHDLRQPIHALSLYLGSLQPTAAQQTLVRRMESAIGGLQALYDRVLDISRLEAGTVEPEMTAFNISLLIMELAARHEPLAREKGLEFVVNATPALVQSDAVLLARILDNLLANAVKFTSNGQVEISSARSGDQIVLEVLDTGEGIAADAQKRIFDPYVQLDQQQREGFGLGLSIVRSLAMMLDIALEIESTPGQGTRITLRIPVGNVGEKLASPPEPAEGGAAACHVLLVDDDPTIRAASRLLLESWDMSVSTPDSWQALIGLAEFPDLVLVDHQIWGNHTGFEVIRWLHSKRDIPAIMITGDSSALVRDEARRCNVPLILKPIKPAQLRVAINRALRRDG